MNTMKKCRSTIRRIFNRLANQFAVLISEKYADVKEIETSCEMLQEKVEALTIANEEIFGKMLDIRLPRTSLQMNWKIMIHTQQGVRNYKLCLNNSYSWL